MRRPALILVLLALGVLVGGAVRGEAASSGSSVVAATVLSASSLDTTACTGSDLTLGTFNVLTPTITPTDCSVTFGSTNDTAALRMMQADGAGSALTQYTTPIEYKRAAPQWEGVAAKSTTTAWSVGAAKKAGDPTPLQRTTDGGATWVDQTACTGASTLYDVDHVTADTVVAVGSGNVVCRTTDGVSWSRITPSPSGTWRTVHILPSGQGWLGGQSGKLMSTSDGGATWTALPTPDVNWVFHDLWAASSTRLYGAVADSATPNNVYAVTSADGGTTWSSFLIGNTDTGGWASAVTAVSTTTAMIGTSYGTWRTTNSGSTWTSVDPTSRAICMFALDATTVLAFSGAAPRRSTDGGATWSNVPSPPTLTGSLRGCDAPTTSAVFTAGANDQHMTSADAGSTWSVTPSTYTDQQATSGWSADAWVTVGDFGTIRRTVDGGATITRPSSAGAGDLYDVVAFDPDIAVAVGVSGAIRRSTDRGATWTAVTSGTASRFDGIDRAPDGTLYAVGTSGVVVRSTDDGLTWSLRTPAIGSTLYDVAAVSRTEAFAVGAGGAIMRTTDGGATWTAQTSTTTLPIRAIDTLDGVTLIAVSYEDATQQSVRLRSTNGGATWTSTASSATMWDVAFTSPTTVYIGGDQAFRRSTDGGLTWSTVTVTFDYVYSVAPLDENTVLLTGSADGIARVVPGYSFGDYAFGSNDFTGTSSTFGGCLQTQSGTSSTDWPVAGASNCTAANASAWRPIAQDASTARLARTATSGTGTVDLRFGLKASSTQRPGAYVAQIRFEVIAPG